VGTQHAAAWHVWSNGVRSENAELTCLVATHDRDVEVAYKAFTAVAQQEQDPHASLTEGGDLTFMFLAEAKLARNLFTLQQTN